MNTMVCGLTEMGHPLSVSPLRLTVTLSTPCGLSTVTFPSNVTAPNWLSVTLASSWSGVSVTDNVCPGRADASSDEIAVRVIMTAMTRRRHVINQDLGRAIHTGT
jgi:hypothetical protein